MIRPSEKNRASLKIVLADNDSYMRQGLRNALASEGYRDVRTVGRVSVVRNSVVTTPPDLLIIDVDTPDGDAISLVSEIRDGKWGKNPFLPVILITWDADPAAVSRAAKCGADFILMKPFSPAQLFLRIEAMVFGRKPFIATAGYTGPDRSEFSPSKNVRKYEVPNTLKDKLAGKSVDPAALAERIDRVVRDMNSGRLEQVAITLASKVEDICATFEKRSGLDEIGDTLALIIRIANEIQVAGTGDITKLCASLIKIVEPLQREPAASDAKQMQLLRPLSQSILLAANPDLNEPSVMEEISRAVARFAPKQRELSSRQESAGTDGSLDQRRRQGFFG